LRIELQEGGRGVASASSELPGTRPIDDAKQQADHQVAPQQPGEVLGHFEGIAAQDSGPLGPGHYFPQGAPARLASYRVQCPRDFGCADRLGDRQPEDGDDDGIADLAQELCPDSGQRARVAISSVLVSA
jgi:hypothetical protein